MAPASLLTMRAPEPSAGVGSTVSSVSTLQLVTSNGKESSDMHVSPNSIDGCTTKPLNGNATVSSSVIQEGDESSSDAESEDEVDLQGNPTISQKRKHENEVFAQYVTQKATKVTKEEIETVNKDANDEELTIRALMSNQESAVIINDPREYQTELFERAKQQNVIAVLDTGSGKTLIAVLLLKHILDRELEDRAMGKKPRISFFLVDCVTLVFQQFAVLESNLDQKIDRFCGEMGCDLWVKETWLKIFQENMVIVCTAEILYQCLMHSFISMDSINLLIFDEAHHAKKDHVYARIIKDYYVITEQSKRPKIFGMTASPVDARQDPVKAAQELEGMLHSQIATASDLALLQMSSKKPQESLAIYEQVEYPYDTDLSKHMMKKFGNVEGLSKIFGKAREATSELGEWCANQLWIFALTDEEARKLEQKTERRANKENRPTQILDAQIARVREAKEAVANWPYQPLLLERNCVSPKVLLLHQYLSMAFERPTDSRCIIFVKRRYTARVLAEFLKRVGTSNLKLGVLIGTTYVDPGDIKFSVRQQILTLSKFRKGDLNCLISTSIGEEGLDVPDCNIIVRFDLYSTIIQYIQSRGRARHETSRFYHFVERDNPEHFQNVRNARDGEAIMRQFCQALPQDRWVQGNDQSLEKTLSKERSHKRYVDPETGATLTYNSSLIVLAHFVGSLPHSPDVIPQATYYVSSENRQFICEVILPANSPLHAMTGKVASRKSIAKRSAAFEACCRLRQMGHLDSNLLPTYHKLLPQMRNAHLALNSKRTSACDMMIKPSLWARTRGTRPTTLYITMLELEKPEDLGRPIAPLALLTRTPLPDFPAFLFHLQNDKTSNVRCTSISEPFVIDSSQLGQLNEFTLRIYYDIFNKKFEVNEPEMSYWLAPASSCWVNGGSGEKPHSLIDWPTVKYVAKTPEIKWTADFPNDELVNRYLVDKWDGGRRWISTGLEPGMKPSDPVPGNPVKQKYMDNIINYSVTLFKNSRTKVTWQEDQPVIRAERILYRLNWLDTFTEQEKNVVSRSYVCPEPLKISALPIKVVSMGYMFPAIITRLEAYLIALEACDAFNLKASPELALEALTKDSDNTEEHRVEQVQLQRGMGKNYERLEFIGDCFLKMATSISLFAQSPDNNEFEYHVKRMVMICNKNLLKTATEKKLYKYIRSMGFSRRNWYPEAIKLLEGKGANKVGEAVHKHHLGDKTIADVCEAMIGAALLSERNSGRMDMAVRAVTELVASPDHDVDKWADYYPLYEKPKYQLAQSTASQLDLAMQIERDLGYRFKHPRLLRSAFIHPSYPFAAELIPCYQRLEFLGDALLDMASISFLFHRYPDKDPQWLTEHKMAMVSNKFLAAVSVKLGFHKHLRSNGAVVEAQNREYVAEIREAEMEANGARDYWTNTKQPPKALSDIVESYIGAVFVDSEFDYAEVEKFFDRHIRSFFEDMSIYDTFANNHPTTFLHNLLSLSFGCANYRLMASELPSCIPGAPSRAIAVVMLHGNVIAEGQASSSKNAKIKASQSALGVLRGLMPIDFRRHYRCDCEGAAQGDEVKKHWAGMEGQGTGMVGSAI